MMTVDRLDTMDTDDPLALPVSLLDRLGHLEDTREQRVAALHATAQARHEARCRTYRGRLMDGRDDLATYRAHMVQSAATLATELEDVPPVVDVALLGERVRIRAGEAAAAWWAEELAQAEQAQRAWTPQGGEQTAEEGHHVP